MSPMDTQTPSRRTAFIPGDDFIASVTARNMVAGHRYVVVDLGERITPFGNSVSCLVRAGETGTSFWVGNPHLLPARVRPWSSRHGDGPRKRRPVSSPPITSPCYRRTPTTRSPDRRSDHARRALAAEPHRVGRIERDGVADDVQGRGASSTGLDCAIPTDRGDGAAGHCRRKTIAYSPLLASPTVTVSPVYFSDCAVSRPSFCFILTTSLPPSSTQLPLGALLASFPV